MLTHDYSHSDLEHNPAQWWKQVRRVETTAGSNVAGEVEHDRGKS